MVKKRPKQESSEQPSFEEALGQLEEIVHLLEEGDIGLHEGLARYEEGVKLLRQSYDLLQRAERQIELLSGVDAEGNPISRPFEDHPTLSQGQEAPGRGPSGSPSEGGSRDGWEDSQPGNNDMDVPRGLS